MNTNYILDLPMCAYNHEKYIAQAIEGVINQKTGYKFRLIIGEDCSTDNSREIIKRYADQYPEKIKAIFHEKNVGAMENSKILFRECTSKYIALCDGDDCWNDAYKLEKQINFLESNPRYVGCFHNTEERYDDDDTIASYLYCKYPEARNISFNDLSYGNLIPTCSVVYRNGLYGAFPEWYYKLKMGDWPLHLLNAQSGDFWYMPQIMGVHRLHKKSMWMLQDARVNNNYVADAYDIMIAGFTDPILKNQLTIGREAFIAPPPKNGLKRKGINFIKRLIK